MCGCAMSGGGFGVFGWLLGTVFMLGFWGLVIWGVLYAIRNWGGGGWSAERELARRYARGDVADDEYRQRLTTLREGRAEVSRHG